MTQLAELPQVIAGMPIGGLIATILLAGFGLAAFAIYAVLAIAREHR